MDSSAYSGIGEIIERINDPLYRKWCWINTNLGYHKRGRILVRMNRTLFWQRLPNDDDDPRTKLQELLGILNTKEAQDVKNQDVGVGEQEQWQGD